MKLLSRLFLAIAISFFTIEIVSAICLTLVDLKRGKSLNESLVNRYQDIYLAYNFEPILYGSYDPVTQFHPLPNSVLPGKKSNKHGSLRYNKYGFLDNESKISDLQIFPKKNDNTFRILLLGGSSALGIPGNMINIVAPQETIAAILEKKLNKNLNSKNFQVLNFAQISGWSGNNLVRLSQYLIHLDPDMVLAYNGFNDALLENIQGDRIINWDNSTMNLYNKSLSSSNAPRKIQISRSKIFPFTTATLNIFFDIMYARQLKIAPKNIIASKKRYHPLPSEITDYVANKSIQSRSIYSKNMEMLGAISSINKSYFIGFLQPNVAWSLRGKNSQLPDILRKIEPRIYRGYVNDFQALKNIYNKSKFTRFVDVTSIFDDFSNDFIYQPDGFHLTPEGNKIIAQEFFTSINSLLPQITHNPTKK